MFKEKTGLRALMIGIVIACLSFLIFSNPDTGSSHILSEVMNCGHFPLFGIIATALLFYFEFGKARGPKNYFLSWGTAAFLGLLTECIQLFEPDRYFELRDLAYDALGAFTFLAFCYSFRPSEQRLRRTILLGVALICLAVTTPIWLAVAEWQRMLKVFPLISSFETTHDISRWKSHESTITKVRGHSTHGVYSAKVMLFPGEFPGLNTDYFIGDWHGYQTFACDIFLAGDTPLRLTIRINDKVHNQAYSDRYNYDFSLQPGPNRIRIPLKDVALAPHGRPMNMRAVSLICIFSYQLETLRTIFIDNVRLY
jgi:VanZ family protein